MATKTNRRRVEYLLTEACSYRILKRVASRESIPHITQAAAGS